MSSSIQNRITKFKRMCRVTANLRAGRGMLPRSKRFAAIKYSRLAQASQKR